MERTWQQRLFDDDGVLRRCSRYAALVGMRGISIYAHGPVIAPRTRVPTKSANAPVGSCSYPYLPRYLIRFRLAALACGVIAKSL